MSATCGDRVARFRGMTRIRTHTIPAATFGVIQRVIGDLDELLAGARVDGYECRDPDTHGHDVMG